MNNASSTLADGRSNVKKSESTVFIILLSYLLLYKQSDVLKKLKITRNWLRLPGPQHHASIPQSPLHRLRYRLMSLVQENKKLKDAHATEVETADLGDAAAFVMFIYSHVIC